MFDDPIVNEVRKAGEELAKKYNYDLHLYFEGLRKNEKKNKSVVESNMAVKE